MPLCLCNPEPSNNVSRWKFMGFRASLCRGRRLASASRARFDFAGWLTFFAFVHKSSQYVTWFPSIAVLLCWPLTVQFKRTGVWNRDVYAHERLNFTFQPKTVAVACTVPIGIFNCSSLDCSHFQFNAIVLHATTETKAKWKNEINVKFCIQQYALCDCLHQNFCSNQNKRPQKFFRQPHNFAQLLVAPCFYPLVNLGFRHGRTLCCLFIQSPPRALHLYSKQYNVFVGFDFV